MDIDMICFMPEGLKEEKETAISNQTINSKLKQINKLM